MAINWPIQKLSNRANASFRSTNLFTDFFVTICPFQLADAIPPTAVDDKKGRLGSRGKACMHRRNTQQTHSAYGSFKRRSIKLRQKDTREVDECTYPKRNI